MIRLIKKGFLLTVVLLLMMCQMVSVSAREIDQMPDLETGRTGTLSVTLSYKDNNGKSVAIEGVTLTAVKVADLTVINGGSPTYTLTSDFADTGIVFDGMNASESNQAAETLNKIAVEKKLSGKTAVTGENGKASFTGLEPAMYLVMQTGNETAIPEYTDMKSYLVSVPLGENENGQASWNYEVNSVPKMELEAKPALGRITVTKRVAIYRDDDIALLDAFDAVFYFGIFEDEEGMKRYADYPIQKARLKNSSFGTAEFNNLPEGTYYIFETDEAGNVIKPGERVVDFAPPYTCIIEGSETNAVTIAPAKGVTEGSITFNNVFDDLPWGYSIDGTLSIKKNVYKGDQRVKVNDTFYAGIFTKEDGEFLLYHVVELKQNGTVTVPVVLDGSETKPQEYWVFETDSAGNRINKESFGYEVSGEGSVIVRLDNLDPVIELTNSVIEESMSEYESSSTETTSTVRTGDETPITMYLILAAAALLIIVVLVMVRVIASRKRSN